MICRRWGMGLLLSACIDSRLSRSVAPLVRRRSAPSLGVGQDEDGAVRGDRHVADAPGVGQEALLAYDLVAVEAEADEGAGA